MARKRKPVKKQQSMRLTGRKWKVVAAVAALAALATVLVLVASGAPDDDAVPGDPVLATVNGEEITAEEVARIQQRMLRWDNVALETEEVLEQLIAERVLYREAIREGYEPTLHETERKVRITLEDMGLHIDELHARLAEEGLSYMEYLEERRVQLAIVLFVDDVVEITEVTEEEARRLYDDYRELFEEMYPDTEPPAFEDMRETLISALEAQRREEAVSSLVSELRRRAEIVYTQSE